MSNCINYPRNVNNLGGTAQFSSKLGPSQRKCPPPTPVFTGRQDILLKMHEYFSTDIGKRHIFVLHGLGGVGKSQITLKFIEECQVDMNPTRYVCGMALTPHSLLIPFFLRFSDVFIVDASSVETLEGGLRNIAIAKGTGDSAEDALRWLSGENGEWLLFIDNADDPTLNLRGYFPPCCHGNIIVTSRNSEIRIHGPQSNLKVSSLTPGDAKDLLLKVSGVREEESAETVTLATNIVEVCYSLSLILPFDEVGIGTRTSRSRCGSSRRLYFQIWMWSCSLS
jgi:hypothetical protein